MKLILTITTVFLLSFQKSKVIFDIPALKNKSIIEIKRILGKPKIDDLPLNYQTQSGVTGDAFFEKDGFILEVTYNPRNYKVNDFFIAKNNPVSDYKVLEIAGNVLNNKDFILNPIKYNKDPKMFTGVNVTLK